MGNLPKKRERPEDKVRANVRQYFELRGCFVQIFHNDQYQIGVPDVYISAAKSPVFKFDHRWVDTKYEHNYRFTAQQLKIWPEWERKGEGIWILTDGTDEEARKLFQPPNWRHYLRPRELKIVNQNIEELLRQHDQDVLGGLQGLI